MSAALSEVPLWAAILASAFLLAGTGLTLLGAIGLVRLGRFYERLHAPTLATSWGTGGIVMASIIAFTTASDRLVLHELLIGVFVTVTTPVTLMMLGRAALYRDRSELNPGASSEISGREPERTTRKGDAS